ncbi:hypothetical protein [Bradyrhizobium sp. USDA 4506]
MFLPSQSCCAGLLQKSSPEFIHAELKLQLATIAGMFGAVPDFVGALLHVRLYPSPREPSLDAVKELTPNARSTNTARSTPLSQRLAEPKALCLVVLIAVSRAGDAGTAVNPVFVGLYDFDAKRIWEG